MLKKEPNDNILKTNMYTVYYEIHKCKKLSQLSLINDAGMISKNWLISEFKKLMLNE